MVMSDSDFCALAPQCLKAEAFLDEMLRKCDVAP